MTDGCTMAPMGSVYLCGLYTPGGSRPKFSLSWYTCRPPPHTPNPPWRLLESFILTFSSSPPPFTQGCLHLYICFYISLLSLSRLLVLVAIKTSSGFKGIDQRILRGVDSRLKRSVLLNWKSSSFIRLNLKGHYQEWSIKPLSAA